MCWSVFLKRQVILQLFRNGMIIGILLISLREARDVQLKKEPPAHVAGFGIRYLHEDLNG